jgi:hypothetical protein
VKIWPGPIYPLSKPFYYPYASPCVDERYRLVRYSTFYCTYNMYVKCVHCAKRPTFSPILLSPTILSFPFLSPFFSLLSPFPFSLSFLSPILSPIYLHILCTLSPFPYTYLLPFPYTYLYMYLSCLDVILTWRGLLFFIEPFPFPLFFPPIYTKICTYYTYIYNLLPFPLIPALLSFRYM